MTTVTPQLQQETARAWSDYAESTRGLEGADYDRVEKEAWEELQATLQALGVVEPPMEDASVG